MTEDVTMETVVAKCLARLVGWQVVPSDRRVVSAAAVHVVCAFLRGSGFDEQALLSFYRLGDVGAALRFLDEVGVSNEEEHRQWAELSHCGGPSYPGLGFFLPFRFVRLRPSTGRQVHYIGSRCYKAGNWYRTPRSVVVALLKEPANESRGNEAFEPLFEFAVGHGEEGHDLRAALADEETWR